MPSEVLQAYSRFQTRCIIISYTVLAGAKHGEPAGFATVDEKLSSQTVVKVRPAKLPCYLIVVELTCTK